MHPGRLSDQQVAALDRPGFRSLSDALAPSQPSTALGPDGGTAYGARTGAAEIAKAGFQPGLRSPPTVWYVCSTRSPSFQTPRLALAMCCPRTAQHFVTTVACSSEPSSYLTPTGRSQHGHEVHLRGSHRVMIGCDTPCFLVFPPPVNLQTQFWEERDCPKPCGCLRLRDI